MHGNTTADAIRQFREAMRERGLVPSALHDIVPDGAIHRCDVADKGPSGKGDGSYVLRLDGKIPFGWFKNWIADRDVQLWRYDPGYTLTEADRCEIDREIEKARREHETYMAEAHAKARVKARKMWRSAEPAQSWHEYCERKQVEPGGLRMIQFSDGDKPLLVPMYDADGKLQNLQFIHTDRNRPKHGLRGGRVRDGHYWIVKPKQAARGDTICVCEGWATGVSIYQATGHAVIITFGSNNLISVAQGVRKRYRKHRIIIAADDDWKENGNPGLTEARLAAIAVAGSIAVPVFGQDREAKQTDFNDMMIAVSPEAVRRAFDETVDPDGVTSDLGDTGAGRPVIRVVDGQIAHTIDAAQAALLKVGVPIFVRGRMLVEPITVEREAADDRITKVTVFTPLDEYKLSYLLNKYAAVFERYDARQRKWIKIDPPGKATKALVTLHHWQFPEVIGIVGAPTVRPDGSILSAFGYDPATRLWCQSDIKLPPIADQPTLAQAETSLQLLKHLLSGFPFVSAVDRAVALAAILTAVLRGAFDVAPLIGILAHEAGTGKSYLVDLISNIINGRNCPVITASKSSEEMEKRLGALLLEGASITSLDNVSFNLEGDLLCQMTTQTLVRVRVLSKSVMPECEWRGTMFATGNNIRIVGDLVRRALVCRLDAKLERPELRAFKFNPIQRVQQDRGAYIAAAITIARAYATSKPKAMPALAGFSGWSRVVREPLIWLGEEDPVKSMEKSRALDPERAAADELVSRWSQRIGVGKPVTTGQVIAIANQLKSVNPTVYQFPKFRALLVERVGTAKADAIDGVRLGRWLTSIHGRIYGGLRIDLVLHRGRVNEYVLTAIDDE